MEEQNCHIQKLDQMCRICGKKASSKTKPYPYLKNGFKEELKEIYNIDVESENSEVFPTYICSNDTRNLYRLRKDADKSNASKYKTEIFDFLPHSNEDCRICSIKNKGRPAKRRKLNKPNANIDILEGSSASSSQENGKGNNMSTQTSFTGEDKETFPFDLLKQLIKGFAQNTLKEKELFFMDLIHEMPPCDVEILSYCLGKKAQHHIVDDVASFALQYKDPKAMASFDATEWLKGRNKTVVSFSKGICNLEFQGNAEEKGLGIARGVEQLYMLRCPQLISPISFLVNISVYTLTGSKLAVDILGNCSPAGHYKTVTNWLREQGTNVPEIPVGDLMNVFDNEQIIGRKSTIRPNQKVNISIITNKGVVPLKSDKMLQSIPDLKPKLPQKFNVQNEHTGIEYLKEDARLLKTVTSEMMSQSSERITKMEKDHYEQLYYFVDASIEVVKQEQVVEGESIEDSIDQKVAKDAQDDIMVQCTMCGTLNGKRKLICSGCNEREGLKTAKELKRKPADKLPEKTITYKKLAFTNEADSTTHIESSVYDHIPTNHVTSHAVILTDPVFCNPNSYETVAMVLRKIGKDNGIFRYGGSLRKWTFVCCDGLPYVICKKLQEEAVICTEDNCNKKFLSKAKFIAHAQQIHPDKEYCECVHEFDWFYLRIGAGHYEMNLIKSFFELNWVPFLEPLCERMGFVSEAAKQYAKACKDLHKSWNLLLIFHLASLRELVIPYVRHCLRNGLNPEGKHFFEYNNEVYKSNDMPNFKYLMDQVCRFSQAIINFRMAIRRNNSEMLKSAKYMTKELFHGRQHPKYQEIELNDTVQDMLMPGEVQSLNDAYSSITTTNNKSTGQDFDFILEEKNRQLKAWIPKGVPTDAIWQTVCRNNLILEEIKENSLQLFGIQSEKGKSKPLDVEDAVHNFRCLLRSTDYINKVGDHTSLSSGIALDEELVDYIKLASTKRAHSIKKTILGENLESTVFLRNPLPITPSERAKIYSIENLTVVQIKEKIYRLLNIIPEGMQFDYHQQLYNNDIKGKNKEAHIRFLQALQEATYMDTAQSTEGVTEKGSRENTGSDIDVDLDTSVTVYIESEEIDSGDEKWQKPKPGTSRETESTQKKIDNNIQKLRMAKSRAIANMRKQKDRLVNEQKYEPVEVLFVVFEKKTKRFKYDGSGFLLDRFERGQPLTDGIPKKTKQQRQGCVNLDVRASKEKGVKFLTPEKYAYSFTQGSSQSLAQEQRAQLENVVVRSEVSEKVAVKIPQQNQRNKKAKRKIAETFSNDSEEEDDVGGRGKDGIGRGRRGMNGIGRGGRGKDGIGRGGRGKDGIGRGGRGKDGIGRGGRGKDGIGRGGRGKDGIGRGGRGKDGIGRGGRGKDGIGRGGRGKGGMTHVLQAEIVNVIPNTSIPMLNDERGDFSGSVDLDLETDLLNLVVIEEGDDSDILGENVCTSEEERGLSKEGNESDIVGEDTDINEEEREINKEGNESDIIGESESTNEEEREISIEGNESDIIGESESTNEEEREISIEGNESDIIGESESTNEEEREISIEGNESDIIGESESTNEEEREISIEGNGSDIIGESESTNEQERELSKENIIYSVGEFIEVEYVSKKKSMKYAAEIIDIVDGEPYVTFLENTSSDSMKKRKHIEETALVEHRNIIQKLPFPETMVKGRTKMLYFP